MQNLLLTLMLCLTSVSRQSFVDTAPISQGITADNVLEKDSDADVEQLKNLKKSTERTLDLLKSEATIYTNVDGQGESHSDVNEEIKENGNLIAGMNQHVDTVIPAGYNKSITKSQTDVNIPSKGIHKSIVQLPHDFEIFTRNDNTRSPALNIYPSSKTANSVEKVDSSSAIRYSPLDVAEYVFWTGDEKGVTLSIEEFLQEGLMTREAAISFLQQIKYNLEYLKSHYTELGLSSQQPLKDQEVKNKPPRYKQNEIYKKTEFSNNFDGSQLRQESSKKGVLESSESPLSIINKNEETSKTQESDYDMLLDKLRVADFLYTEYSLEEVIYQLAKVMFTQSLIRGSAEAQQALQKFTNFLEVEAERGHISKALEKKVLDVLIASLSDTLTDHPQLLITAKESLEPSASNADRQHFIKQFLEFIPDDKLVVRDLFMYKQQKPNNQKNNELNESNIASQIHIDFEKYKNS